VNILINAPFTALLMGATEVDG